MYMFKHLGQSWSRLFALSLLSLLSLPAAACDGEEAEVITVETGNSPALVAYLEEGTAQWQSLVAGEDGKLTFTASGPYRVVIVCEAASGGQASVEVKQYARTPEDGASLEHDCAGGDRPFHLRGQVSLPGVAYFGDLHRAGADPDWQLDIPAARGTYDLVMRAGERIAIRRDIEIAADKDLGSIDLAPASTEALVPMTFTVSNAQQGELISASTRLDTGSTVAILQDAMSGSGGWATKLAPESVLQTTDRQTAILSAAVLAATPEAQNRYRTLQRDVRVGASTSAALPEPLGPVTFEVASDRLTAKWSTLPEHDEVALRWHSITMAGTKDHVVAVSRSFLEATEATSAALELSNIPGFKPEWRHAPASQQTHELTASRSREGEKALSQVNERAKPAQ
jgi:hypothetical protein